MAHACCGDATGNSGSPLESMHGPREKLMYVSCLQPRPDTEDQMPEKPDYLATIDIDPESPTYCQVIHRLYMPEIGDEVHHFGWNACVSCKNPLASRKYLIVPGFFSGNINIIDATTNPQKPFLLKHIKGTEIKEKFGLTYPHTVHCIPNGDVMIHTLGDSEGEGRGNFYLLDGVTFQPKERWNTGNEVIKGHDFWYQPRHNIMISTEFGAPKKFTKGFFPEDMAAGYYGSKIHLWKWQERELFQTIDLGTEGAIPMEVRFVHNPDKTDCFIVTAVGASVYHVSMDLNGKWNAKKVISIPNKIVKKWLMPFVPALITDQLISLDDKYLFITCYLHGDVRQYDITDPDNPRLVSQVFVGGSTLTDTMVEVEKDEELSQQPDRLVIKGTPIYGGPHMVQLSRDRKRLYVTMSIMTPWDKEFYHKLTEHGGTMIMLDVTSEGMKVNHNFLVDFGKEPDGAVRGHEMRYPGGDCTSDVWV